jgi:class 3 adenylate cyclase
MKGAPGEAGGQGGSRNEPIADLFPNTTILFADISGFTAWSSEREPSQVFILLETLYRAMDKAAKRLGVFKVETVGDCYVAATGIPEPQKYHAQILAWKLSSVLEPQTWRCDSVFTVVPSQLVCFGDKSLVSSFLETP